MHSSWHQIMVLQCYQWLLALSVSTRKKKHSTWHSGAYTQVILTHYRNHTVHNIIDNEISNYNHELGMNQNTVVIVCLSRKWSRNVLILLLYKVCKCPPLSINGHYMTLRNYLIQSNQNPNCINLQIIIVTFSKETLPVSTISIFTMPDTRKSGKGSPES